MSSGRIISAVILCTQVFATSVSAETGVAYPEFTSKRLKPPASGEKRTLVQIDPTEELWIDKVAAYTSGLSPLPQVKAMDGTGEGPGLAGSGDYEWFWELVQPGIAASPQAHFDAAISAILKPPDGKGIATPRLQRLQTIADTYGTDILSASIGTNVSPALALAVISVESAGRSDAVSHAGAQGLMQLIPATAERFGVSDSTNPQQNIKGGVAYLDWLLKEFNGDVVLALAGYNAGENAVKSNGGVPPYKETRAYVPKVLAAWQVARGLCLTPPELPSDGCVFARRLEAKND